MIFLPDVLLWINSLSTICKLWYIVYIVRKRLMCVWVTLQRHEDTQVEQWKEHRGGLTQSYNKLEDTDKWNILQTFNTFFLQYLQVDVFK